MSIVSKRLNAYLKKRLDYPYAKAASKMTKDEQILVIEFIQQNDHLDKGEFELKVNRMFLDKPHPKNWISIMELLTVCNTAAEEYLK